MPGLGLVPARGNWESRWFETLSTATFAKGSLVNLGADYRLKEYASTDSQVLGIAASHSTASQTIRGLSMVQVFILAANCTAYSDITTGLVQSAMSIGKHVLARYGGHHDIRSEPMHGSTFTMVLPAARVSALAADAVQ